ncbi:MAG: DUF3826 domain-containing protein [Prevotella sp.]|nr:DUF3826 domain-containing protein [Prevotella sp.]
MIRKFFIAALAAFMTTAAGAVELNSEGRNPEYVASIVKRSQKCTDALGITGTDKGKQVLNIIANRYFALNDIYAERDSVKNIAKQKQGDEKKMLMEAAEAKKDSKLYRSHFGFDADLSIYLTAEEIVTVKDVMTYNVVKVTSDAYSDMIPRLTAEEKAQIVAWLKEARELAIDAENSNKKHETFKKYKGRINNYLSKRGYDISKEREAWGERVKARGGKL